jgi:hypothetical protein
MGEEIENIEYLYFGIASFIFLSYIIAVLIILFVNKLKLDKTAYLNIMVYTISFTISEVTWIIRAVEFFDTMRKMMWFDIIAT